VGHGGWESWVERNLTFSLRTAQLYMRIARAAREPAKAQRVASLTLRAATHVLSERALVATPRRPDDDAEAHEPDKDGRSKAQLSRLLSAWRAADSAARVEFLRRIRAVVLAAEDQSPLAEV
jgi:hypothetical protein